MELIERFERFMQSSFFRQSLQEAARDELLARQSDFQELIALRVRRQEHRDTLDKPIAAAKAEERRKAASLEAARSVRCNLEAEQRGVLATVDAQILRLVNRLRANADPGIHEARARMWDQYMTACARGVSAEDVVTGQYDRDGRPIRETRSNRRAGQRVLAAVKAARERLEALQIEAPDDVPAAIAAIEASVPWDDLAVLEPETAA